MVLRSLGEIVFESRVEVEGIGEVFKEQFFISGRGYSQGVISKGEVWHGKLLYLFVVGVIFCSRFLPWLVSSTRALSVCVSISIIALFP